MLNFLKNILLVSVLAFLGFLISNKEYKKDFDRLLEKVKKELENHSIYYLVFICVVSALLRFWNLGAREFWYDEAFTSVLIKQPWGNFFSYIFFKDLHPPLYYTCLKVWAYIFGFSDFGLRSFSALFGVLTIPLIYKFTRKFSKNEFLGLSSSLVFAVNPFLIRYSQEARAYSLLVFLTVGVVYSLYNRRWFLSSLLFSVAILTHYIALFLAPSILIFIIADSLRSGKFNTKSFLSLFLPGIVLAFWLPVLKTHFSQAETLLGWVVAPQFKDLFNSIEIFILGEYVGGLKSVALFGSIFFLTIYFFAKSSEKKRLKGLFLLSCGLLPFLEIFFVSKYLSISLYIDRTLIAFLVIFAIYLLFSAQVLGKHLGPLTLFCYIFVALTFHANIETKNIGYKKLSEFAQESYKLIVMADPKQYGTLKHYLNENTARLVKVQSDFEGYWPLIFPEDIIERAEIKEAFYLAHEGPISGWDTELRVGQFYLYNWQN